MNRFTVPKEPCGSCPYRKDVPAGVWHPEEYTKLSGFTPKDPRSVPAMGTFLCHNHEEKDRVLCRGWTFVERESPAVKLLVYLGRVEPDDVCQTPRTPLFETGQEAALHGLSGVKKPTKAARRLQDKITRGWVKQARGKGRGSP